MRFGEREPPSKIYKEGQMPKGNRRKDQLQITDAGGKHSLPLSLEQFQSLQDRYYTSQQKKPVNSRIWYNKP